MSIAIVTDSTADIPLDLVEKYDIQVMPNILIIDGEQVEDSKSFSRQEFYTRLPSMKTFPTTATASSGSYQQLYENLLNNGFSQVVSIHVSGQLSGIMNAATAGAQLYGESVRVIDSDQVSMGLGFQVLAAAEAAKAGRSLEYILEHLADTRRRVKVIAMIDTLEYVRRSGRVSWARAGLGTLLRIKPFVEVKDGLVQNVGEVRTRGKGIKRLIELIQEMGPLERVAILHTNAETEARQLLNTLDLSKISPLIVNITTVIGAHVGPNALGVAAVTQW